AAFPSSSRASARKSASNNFRKLPGGCNYCPSSWKSGSSAPSRKGNWPRRQRRSEESTWPRPPATSKPCSTGTALLPEQKQTARIFHHVLRGCRAGVPLDITFRYLLPDELLVGRAGLLHAGKLLGVYLPGRA